MSNQLPLSYEVEIEWLVDSKGELYGENLPDLQVAPPPEFGGAKGYWTPEHLFVASISSCYLATFLAIAGNSKLEFVSFHCSAVGTLEKPEGGVLQITQVTLNLELVIPSSQNLYKASRVLEKTKQHCLISNSIKTTVKIESKIMCLNTQESMLESNHALVSS